MILFNDVIEILGLVDLDIRVMIGVVADDRRRVDATLVVRNLLRNTITTAGITPEAQHRFMIPPNRQREGHHGASLVDCEIPVFPCALGPHIRSYPVAGRHRAGTELSGDDILQHRFFKAQIRHEPLLFRVLLLALAQPFISEGSNPSYFLRQG